jgi:hypothetical protein
MMVMQPGALLRRLPLWLGLLVCLLPGALVSGQAAVPVTTRGYDNARTGTTADERLLNPTTVAATTFGKLFSYPVTGHIYAQPLYLPAVDLPDQGQRNLVFIATMHNLIYAFDADQAEDALWIANLGEPFTRQIYPDLTGGEDGILSTPVIDPAAGVLYAVARHAAGERAVHRLHALDIRTGMFLPGSPVDITLSAPGRGRESVGGTVSLNSVDQLQRPALLLQDGYLYVAFGSANDYNIWHGWVAAFEAATLTLDAVFNTSPDSYQAGIWMGGGGISSDGEYLYVTAANGRNNLAAGGRDYGLSLLKLRHTPGQFVVADSFTPFDQETLSLIDSGLGSTAVMVAPGGQALITGGKDGNLYVFDRADLGGLEAEGQSLAQRVNCGVGIMYAQPVLWAQSPEVSSVFCWNDFDVQRAYRLDAASGLLEPQAASVGLLRNVNRPIGGMSLSWDGSDPLTGILWSLVAPSADVGNRAGVLVAVAASDLTRLLYTSEDVPERDSLGELAKFNVPMVANGRVYVPTFSGQVGVYGLLSQ